LFRRSEIEATLTATPYEAASGRIGGNWGRPQREYGSTGKTNNLETFVGDVKGANPLLVRRVSRRVKATDGLQTAAKTMEGEKVRRPWLIYFSSIKTDRP